MNKTLEYINQNYHQDIKGHSYINRSKFDFLKKGQYIKAINERIKRRLGSEQLQVLRKIHMIL